MVLEVALRNAIDVQLASWNKAQSGNARNQGRLLTEDWIANPATPLHRIMRDALAEARRQANTAAGRRLPDHPRFGTSPNHDDVLAQISFGKWPALMPYGSGGRRKGRPHVALWEEALIDAFPHAPADERGKRDVSSKLHRLHHLRNRIAHGENILSAQAEHRLVDALFLSRYIDPALGDWIMKLSRVRTVFRERP